MIKFKEPPLLLLLLLASFAAVSAVLFTPALPGIAHQFGVSEAKAQLSMTIFLAGYALGHLIYAPLSNRYGRKYTLYIGIVLAIVGCLIILSSHWRGAQVFDLFIFGRFILALGSCSGMKIVYTMIGDLYKDEIARKKFSMLGVAFSVLPALGIGLGGFLTKHWGWESCFYFLMAYGFLLLFCSALLLPETYQVVDKSALHWEKIKADYLSRFKDKKLITCALIMGLATSIIYIFFTESPFIGIEDLGLSPHMFGLWSLLPPLGLLVGAILSHYFAGKKDVFSIFSMGNKLILSMSAVMFVLFWLRMVNIGTLFVPMMVINLGNYLMFLNASALAMTQAQDKAHTSAVINFLNMAICTISVFVIEMLPSSYAYFMPLIFIGLGSLMVIFRHRLSMLRP